MTRIERILRLAYTTNIGCSPYYGILPSLIKERNYRSGIEIGVLFGGHAEAILAAKPLRFLIGIDPYEMFEEASEMSIKDQGDFDLVYSIAMAHLDTPRYRHFRMTSDDAFPYVRDMGLYDFVFIDGMHTYDQLKKDLDNYSQLIRIGGIVACHDYNHPDFPLLTNAIDEFASLHNTEIIICPMHTIYMNKTW